MQTHLDATEENRSVQGADPGTAAGGDLGYALLEEEKVLSWNDFRRDGDGKGKVKRENLWSVVRNEHSVLGLCYTSHQSSTPLRTRFYLLIFLVYIEFAYLEYRNINLCISNHDDDVDSGGHNTTTTTTYNGDDDFGDDNFIGVFRSDEDYTTWLVTWVSMLVILPAVFIVKCVFRDVSKPGDEHAKLLCCFLVSCFLVTVFFACVLLTPGRVTTGCTLMPTRRGDWALVFLVNAALEWLLLVLVKVIAREACSRKVAGSLAIDVGGAAGRT